MEMVIQLSIIKQMAITFERHNLKSEFNRALHLSSKKSQAGFLQLQLAVLHKTGFQKFGKPSRNLSNSRKAMIILMKTLGTERILDARGYQIEG
jgi:hypothetical protein